MVKTEMPWFRHWAFACLAQPSLHADHNHGYAMICNSSILSIAIHLIHWSYLFQDSVFPSGPSRQVCKLIEMSTFHVQFSRLPHPESAFKLFTHHASNTRTSDSIRALVFNCFPTCGDGLCANCGLRDQDMADVIWKWYCLRSWIRTWNSSKRQQVLRCVPSSFELQALLLVCNRSSTSRIYCFAHFFWKRTSAALTETSAARVSEILQSFRDSTALGVSHLVLENNFCCPACQVLYVGIAEIVHSGMFYRIQWTVLTRQDTNHLADETNVNSHQSCQCQCMISC